MDVEIRPYRAADEEEVVQLWHDCGLVVPWNDPRRDIAIKMAWQPGLFLVATVDEDVVATVMAGYEGHRGWINYLAVAPGMQRQGLGQLLMEEVETRLAQLGCPKINLQIRSSNRAVMTFYQSIGYEVNDVIGMGKRLSS
jgi:ribosomal protein S18 acetylase RimI-like enzyme